MKTVIKKLFRGRELLVKALLFMIVPFVMIGCSGGGGSSDAVRGTQYNTGVFLDSAVEGVKYKTSSGLEGYTNIKGEYQYKTGDTVEFLVGDVSLGEVNAKDLVSVLELDSAIEVMMLLQALDDDKNPDNGINISKETFKLFTSSGIDVSTVSPDDADFLANFESIAKTPFAVNSNDALEHANYSLMLENLKAVSENLYDYYVGNVNIYNNNPMINQTLLQTSSTKRVALYHYAYVTKIELSLMQMNAKARIDGDFDSLELRRKAIADAATIMTESLALAAKDPKDFSVALHLVDRTKDYASGQLLEHGQNIIDEQFPNVPDEIKQPLFSAVQNVYSCAEMFAKPDMSSKLGCATALGADALNIVNDAHSSWELYASSKALNTLTVLDTYLTEYFLAGEDLNFLYQRYGVSSEEALIEKLKSKVGDYSFDSTLFTTLKGNFIGSVRSKTVDYFNKYGLKYNYDVGQNIALSPRITKGKYNVEDNAFSICYTASNSSYFYLQNISLKVDIFDGASTLGGKQVSIPSMGQRSSLNESCINIPLNTNVSFNNNYFTAKATFNYTVESVVNTVEASQVIYLSEGDIFDILKQSAYPNVVIDTTARVKDNDALLITAFQSHVDSSQGTLLFNWKQVDVNGYEVIIQNATTHTPNIALPSLPSGIQQKTIWLELTATASLSKKQTIKTVKIVVDSSMEANIEQPTANAGIDATINLNETYSFHATNANVKYTKGDENIVWIWLNGAGEIISGEQDFNYIFKTPGSYIFTLEVSDSNVYNENIISRDTISITVNGIATENNVPQASSQSVGLSEGESKLLTLAATDADADNLSYLVVSQPSHGTLSGVAPNLTYTPYVGYSGSDSFTFKANDGKTDSNVATVSLNIAQLLFKQIAFMSESAPLDNSVIERGSNFTKTWTFKNSGNLDLASVHVVTVSAPTGLQTSVTQNVNGSLAQNAQTSYALSIDVPSSLAEGTYEATFKLADANGDLKYANGNTAAFSYKFVVAKPNDFKALAYLSSTVYQMGENALLSIVINDGNSPYTATVSWGDGATTTQEIPTASNAINLAHAYASTGSYVVNTQVVDVMGQSANVSNTLEVLDGVQSVTKWSVSGANLETNTNTQNVPVAVTAQDGYATYDTSWTPQESSLDYWLAYKLPVPDGVFKMNRKMRLTLVSKAGELQDHDRVLTYALSNGKSYAYNIMSNINDGSGFIRTKDFQGSDTKRDVASLTDNALGVMINQRAYAIESSYGGTSNSATLSAFKYENATYTLLSGSGTELDASASLKEIAINYKGNGTSYLLFLEYDKNGDGVYSSEEKIILNTQTMDVDWSAFVDVTQEDISAKLLDKSFYQNYCGNVSALTFTSGGVIINIDSDGNESSQNYRIEGNTLYVDFDQGEKAIVFLEQTSDYIKMSYGAPMYYSQTVAQQNPENSDCSDTSNTKEAISTTLNWSGTIQFLDENNNPIAIPSDAKLRITPDVEQVDGAWGGFDIIINSDGTWNTNTVYPNTEMNLTNFTSAHTYQFAVYADSNNNNNWDSTEKVYGGFIENNPSEALLSDFNNQTVMVTINTTVLQLSQVVVKKTGQTKSYDANGNEVTDGSLKDDGYYQKGLTQSYTRASDTVTDELTGLMWQDDAAAASTAKQWLTTDNYNTCSNDTSSPACYDTSGDTAATYCSELTLGGYTDWRLPTSIELEGILDYGKVNPAIDTTYFNNVSSSSYWSSTTGEGFKDGAWAVGFNGAYVEYGGKDANGYVRCARVGE